MICKYVLITELFFKTFFIHETVQDYKGTFLILQLIEF